MKTQQNIIRRLTFAAGFVMALSSAHAQLRTWTGGGTNDFWSTAANWSGTSPGATGATLIFDGNTRLGPNNDIVTSLNGITFAASAGSFVLGGNTFILNGNITNNSGVLQTIDNAMTLNGQRNIDAAQGDIRISGAIGQNDATARILTKNGAGTLTLAGANTFTGDIRFNQGKLVLDAGAGGSLAAGGPLVFGFNQAVSATNQGGTFEARGAAVGTTTIHTNRQMYLGSSSGANRVVVDTNGGDGTTLEFSSFNFHRTPDRGTPTLNINLSLPGSAFKLNDGTNFMSNGVSHFATVTDGTKTGFATRDSGTGLVTRNTTMSSLPTSGNNGALNTSAAGTTTLTADTTVNTVTITGSGAVNGGYYLSANAILMEEGAGDYTIGTTQFGNANLIVHQYSTAGTLIVASDLRSTGNYSNINFAKTGPGAVVFEGTAADTAGALDVQQGLLKVDGSFRAVQVAQVRDGATLSGSGQIGGGAVWIYNTSANTPNVGYPAGNSATGATRYTPVNVWAGGTLDGSYSEANALDITGTLTLHAASTFQVDLAGGSFSALSVTNITPLANIVTLNGDLKLTLGYAPTLNSEIDLLTSTDGLITGTFGTINGAAATPTFVMGDYEFEINYGSNRVWLETIAVPEPGTAMLLLLAGACTLVRRRR